MTAPAVGIDGRRVLWVIGGLAFGKLCLLLATAGRYGYYIDEFYYLACARHPAWG
jgi:hypothetical protein